MDKFTSDPHLSHKNIINFERKQFKTIDEHDTFIKYIIQSNVKPNDTLYLLGDVGEMSDKNIEFWKSLPCKTILIRGNHDTQKGKLLKAFDVVSDVPIFYKKRILLSHEPLPVTNETINVHGHLHGSHLNMNSYINLSIHVADYKIWTEKDLEKRLAIQPKISQHFMFEWYAKNYEFHNKKDDVAFDIFGNIDLEKSRKNQLQKPKLQQKIKEMSFKFLQEYPDYKHADVKSEIEDFMIQHYQNNANYTTKDLKSFIENPCR